MGSREILSTTASRLPPATRQPRRSQQAAMDADPIEVLSPRARPRVRSGRKRGPASSRGWIRPSLSSPRAPASSWRSPPAPPPLVLVGRGRRPRLPVAPRVGLPRPSRSQPQAPPKPRQAQPASSTEPAQVPW
ncbi:translation initiation factor IF-2-like [Triticum aestivum]|uniref:translation initiation factor IF-2-like n=1 Tax=Triticum aestivum TaxID=4565 RepID=UPI001D024C2C|nr:translation initiation factor IF-2-like [Triticum aestivum]